MTMDKLVSVSDISSIAELVDVTNTVESLGKTVTKKLSKSSVTISSGMDVSLRVWISKVKVSGVRLAKIPLPWFFVNIIVNVNDNTVISGYVGR